MSRLDPSAPKAYIIETYLEAIAQAYEVDYTADQAVMAAHQRQKDIKSEDLLNLGGDSGQMFMPAIPSNQPGPSAPPNNKPPGGGGGGGGSFAYPEPHVQPQAPMTFGNQNFSPPPTQFAPPAQPAPKPNQTSQFSSMSSSQAAAPAPLSGEIYNAAGNNNSNSLQGEIYQAPTGGAPDSNSKSKAAEAQYTGQSSRPLDGPPSYTVLHDTDENLAGYNTHQQQRGVAPAQDEEEFDFQLPEIPTGFKKDDDDDNKGGNTGGGDDFDDLEARFNNLRK